VLGWYAIPMTDNPFHAAVRKPAPACQTISGELLFEFVRQRDCVRFRCELRDNGWYGVEAQWFWNEAQFHGRTFRYESDPRIARALAVAWAEAERMALEQ
jgi:hypothetical protein